MKTTWNLDIFYKGLDDPKYEEDIAKLQTLLNDYHLLVTENAASMHEQERVEAILSVQEQITVLVEELYSYVSLSESVDSTNGDLMAQENRLMAMLSGAAGDDAAAEKLLGSVSDIEELCAKSKIAGVYEFRIKEAKKNVSHLLSDELETMVSLMDMTGGAAWGNLQSFLTSTLKVPYEDKVITLSEVRNLAYSDDAGERRRAYEAELAAYAQVEDAVAFSLNNIKNQVTMLSGKRGYGSPLSMTLDKARMSRETLDAMFAAVNDYLPAFRRYMRKKGEYLGYSNGLPFFELFAPIGSNGKKYSPEEAGEYLVNCFTELDPDMGGMMSSAFTDEWIDFLPHPGKVGGAFCAGAANHGQSRILTNFDGTFGAVDTLAHELGHAFHNLNMENEAVLNRDYPMPVAETASTFNEVHLGSDALNRASSDEERLSLLESDLREKNQCIVDIYSRFLFESSVFEQTRDKFLMASDLKELMLDCQRRSYGDGLDPEYLHPYMWLCKSHYYSSGLSFYNFPYTFGNLFAQGLYTMYRAEGSDFMPRYRRMLSLTGVHSMEENGAVMGVDLTKEDFWRASLGSMAEEIDEFCALCDKLRNK